MNTACTCCQHHFIKCTLVIIWPFQLRYRLNILPWTRCLLLGRFCRFSLYDHFLRDWFLCLLSYGLLLSHRLLSFLSSLSPEMTSLFFSPSAPHLLSVWFPYPSHLFSFLVSLSISVSMSYCICLLGDSEGKMVVLALAIGVAEQDDFANIPDLQETAQAAPPPNQEPPPEKRYRLTCESACCMKECGANERTWRIWRRLEGKPNSFSI